MKTKCIFASAVAATCLSCLASADDQKKGAEQLITPPSQLYSERAARLNRLERLGKPGKASGLVGMRVENYQHEKLGKVSDLAVDLESGWVVQVILSTGGFLGVREKDIAVPPGALHCDFANKVIHLDADKEKVKAAPKFELSKWAECCQPTQVLEVYRYYGENPYFSASLDGVSRPDRSENRIADGTSIVHTREATTNSGRMGYVEKGTKLMGMNVKDLHDQKLGKIDNLMVDLPAGRLVAVILSTGGFLGLGDELSVVPPAALRFNQEHDAVILDTTRESLTQAPHFKSTEWPDLGEPIYVERVYRVYQIEPYFSTEIADTDNARRNVRDRNDETLNPMDQGGSAEDRQTTAHVRKDIVAQGDLSVTAKNIKIITANGRVTLRGTVKTEEEKLRLGEIAKRSASADRVDNQLEVKGESSN